MKKKTCETVIEENLISFLYTNKYTLIKHIP